MISFLKSKGGAHKDVNEQAAEIEKVLKNSLKELISDGQRTLVIHRYE